MAFGCNCHKLLPKCRWFDSGPRDPFFLTFFLLFTFYFLFFLTNFPSLPGLVNVI
ncbi:hypothetical protein F5Y11DRAFT_150344 [Daldinia sp. FL1419]|nr:hypothetical protein F5Y11DRAFT_150344 [Daldinia sp. FL1419]